jgi:hypothetical protein
MKKKIIGFVMMSLFFSLIFLVAYIPYDIIFNFPKLSWYMYILVGINMSFLFGFGGGFLKKKT